MADVMDHVAYLSKEIGPRPAGTEEEQQAALYITEHMQKEAGLSAVIEDFTGVSDTELPRAICSGVTVVFALIALIFPVVSLPAAIVSLISAAVYLAEAFDKPLLSRLLSRGVSQNVVAKYEPGYSPETGGTRRRKIVLVAPYDSGKARPELKGPVLTALPIVKWVVMGSFVAIFLVLLLDATVFAQASGAVTIVMTVLTVIFMILSALPLVQFILHKASAYNDGANCNASGVAVLMEAAARVGRGRTDMSAEGSGDPEVVIHGERAAREAGVVPEGAEVSYEAAPTEVGENASPVERLAAAKAAVAALSGKPVSDFMSDEVLNASIPIEMPEGKEKNPQGSTEHEVAETFTPEQIKEAAEETTPSATEATQPETAQAMVPPSGEPAPQTRAAAPVEEQRPSNSLPAWFISAQKKAKHPTGIEKPVQRSRYADALDAAVNESRTYFEEANNAVFTEAQKRVDARSSDIVEVPAPASAWETAHPDFAARKTAQATEVAAPVQSEPVAHTDISATPEVAAVPTDNATREEMAGMQTGDGRAVSAAQASSRQVAVPVSVQPLEPQSTPILPEDMTVPQLDQDAELPLPSFLTAQPQQPTDGARTANRVSVSAGDLPVEAVARMSIEVEEVSEVAEPAPVFVEAVTSATGSIPAIDEDRSSASEHHRITLPPIDETAQPAVQVETLKQRAPLAEATEGGKDAAKHRLNRLPSIDPEHPRDQVAHVPTAEELRSSLPSLSGALPRTEDASSAVSLTGSFAPVGATSAFAPVGDELLEDVDPDDIYIEDADDSDYQESYTDAGAFAGPGYVEMPKSRVRRLFDRFHHKKKKKEEETTPQEWLDVDENFEARSVGAARGSWESFRDEQDDYDQGTPRQSGAYADSYGDDFEEEDDFGFDDSDGGRTRNWYGGAFSRVKMGRVDMRSGKEDEPPLEGEDPDAAPQPEAPEMQKIYQFRNPDINTEVWFVALGADLAGHSGMRAFIEEHAQELRGAIIVELDCLGAGTLSMVESEGGYRVAKTSSRMKRYTRKATHATGLSVGSASLLWKSSAASYAINHGLQAMHLVGMEDGKPASFGDREDTIEGVDEKLLNQRTDFVMELLKSI